MAEYIKREALQERFRKRIKWLEKDVHDQYSLGLFHGCEYDADLINEPPAADVAPVRHGQWLCVDTDTEQFFLCNRCKKKEYWESDYCPNCGCLMDGGAD